MELEARVYQAKNDEKTLSELIETYKPFINSSAAAVTNRFTDCSSDEASVAMLAFCEAVKNFDSKKGYFLPYAQTVIKNRMIDYMRKENPRFKTVTLEHIDNEISETFENPIRLEIESLDLSLEKYNISFPELVECSPKSHKTKKLCMDAVRFIMTSDIHLMQLKKSGRLPVNDIESQLKIPRKRLERMRKYIIAVIEILTGDYPYISEYISYAKELKQWTGLL